MIKDLYSTYTSYCTVSIDYLRSLASIEIMFLLLPAIFPVNPVSIGIQEQKNESSKQHMSMPSKTDRSLDMVAPMILRT
jgi:hypothetical protein